MTNKKYKRNMKNSNRIIKFRAWDKRGKKMHTVSSMNTYPEYLEEYPKSLSAQAFWTNGLILHGNDCYLMQYTGLKDKNGKEIYSGDIIKTHRGSKVEVYFDKIDAWFKFKPSEHKYQWSDLCCGASSNWDNCEVIGNIYENPELLKEEK